MSFIHNRVDYSIHPTFRGFIIRWCPMQIELFFPCVSVLRLPFQNVYFLITPFVYIVQPFSSWSFSFCFPFHLSEHQLLYLLSSILQMCPNMFNFLSLLLCMIAHY